MNKISIEKRQVIMNVSYDEDVDAVYIKLSD